VGTERNEKQQTTWNREAWLTNKQTGNLLTSVCWSLSPSQEQTDSLLGACTEGKAISFFPLCPLSTAFPGIVWWLRPSAMLCHIPVKGLWKYHLTDLWRQFGSCPDHFCFPTQSLRYCTPKYCSSGRTFPKHFFFVNPLLFASCTNIFSKCCKITRGLKMSAQ
jgi:hypothetical protein